MFCVHFYPCLLQNILIILTVVTVHFILFVYCFPFIIVSELQVVECIKWILFQTCILLVRGVESSLRSANAEYWLGIQKTRTKPSRRCHLGLSQHWDCCSVYRLLYYGWVIYIFVSLRPYLYFTFKVIGTFYRSSKYGRFLLYY